MTDIQTNTNLVGPFKLDKEGFKSIGKSLIITVAGAVLGYIGQLTHIIDFGSASSIVAVGLPFAVNFLKKFLLKYESTGTIVTAPTSTPSK